MYKENVSFILGQPGYINFCKDIFDGYFPCEFKIEYPDGVLFSLEDKRDVAYRDGNSDLSSHGSLSEFSCRLPEKVISNGEIRNIKEEVEKLIMEDKRGVSCDRVGTKAKPIWVRTSTYSSSEEDREYEEKERGNNQTCLVQVRWINGSNLFVKMLSSESIGDLKRVLDFHNLQLKNIIFEFI